MYYAPCAESLNWFTKKITQSTELETVIQKPPPDGSTLPSGQQAWLSSVLERLQTDSQLTNAEYQAAALQQFLWDQQQQTLNIHDSQ